MYTLRTARPEEAGRAMSLIEQARAHLREQGVDQWQDGYPDLACIQGDLAAGRGYFLAEGDDTLGYLCLDFGGEPAYDTLEGTWARQAPYGVIHRMAMDASHQGKGLAHIAFDLAEELCRARGVHYMRIDTDEGNRKIQHIIRSHGFTCRGTVWFQNSTKIAFDKEF